MMGGRLLEGFLLGLSTGPSCLVVCLPVLLPVFLTAGPGRSSVALASFTLGRLAAYLAVGALAGGLSFGGGRIAAWVRPLSEAVAGALLLIWFFKAASWRTGCLLTALPAWTKRAPFVLGVLAGVPLCPPLAAGIMRAFSVGTAAGGAALFAGFFAGTTLYFAPLPALGLLSGPERTRRIGALAAALTGTYFLLRGTAEAVIAVAR
jgi:sulfite exporter TauE/SafE